MLSGFRYLGRGRLDLRALVLRATIIILLQALPALGQTGGVDSDPGDPGTGGKNSIAGRILIRGGASLGRRAKVRLRSTSSGDRIMMSDDNGSFTFRRLRGGSYTLVVDAGEEFETVSETVDIIEPARRRADSGVTVPVTIYLEAKQSVRSTVGTIDASAGGVPDAAKDLYKQAVESAHSGDRKRAIEQLKQALAIYPTFMTALNELGVQYMNLKEWAKAAESLRAAIEMGPQAFQPRLNYGIVLVQLKSYKEAAAELQTAVQKDSSSAAAYFYLGRALVNLGNYDAAERDLRQTVSIGGEEATEAHRYLGAVYIEKRDRERAADELEAYLKLAPKAKDAERIRAMVKDLRRQASARPQ
jgi:Tfp pilus assembly protein PilF